MGQREMKKAIIFNSSLETGLRVLILLLANKTTEFDLQRLSSYDYLVVHTKDIGGPESIHPEIPLKSSELSIRREIVSSGLSLLISKGLVSVRYDVSGILYKAEDYAEIFLSLLESKYIDHLKERASWLHTKFQFMDNVEFSLYMKNLTETTLTNFTNTYE